MAPCLRLALGLWFACAASATAQAKRITLADFRLRVDLSDPQIALDGKSIAVVVSRVNWTEDRYDATLAVVDIASGTQRQLTYDRKGVSSPRWSPAGDRLAFLATAGTGGDQGAPQVFVFDMRGGDARQVTDAATGVEQYAWRPDGTDIAYVTADSAQNQKDVEAHNDAFEVGDDGYLTTAAPTPSHIWLVPARGGPARRVTGGPWSVVNVLSPLAWSPDGKSILFSQQPTPRLLRLDQTVVMVLDVATGETRALTGRTTLAGAATYSPDGARIAYRYPRDGDPLNEFETYVSDTSRGERSDETRAVNRNLFRAVWMPDGKSLLLGGHDGTRTALWLMPLGGPARRLDLGEVSPDWAGWIDLSVDKDGGIAFVGSTPDRPSELYYLASATATPRRLTDLNAELAARDLGHTESFEWAAPDGFREDGVVVYPPGFVEGDKYPLVLVIHGGPGEASVREFNLFNQLLAAHGYIVFSPNYRGSDNLGNAYARAIINDPADGPGRDVVAGIAALVKRGAVDTTLIAISGWSYGGYLTTWLTGHYHLWKTAIAGAAVTDLIDDYNLSAVNVLSRYGFTGFPSPWTGNALQLYRDASPISYVRAMKTPTLILSDVRDQTVPVTESYKLYHALRDNGVPVKFIVYPVGGHFPGDPVRYADIERRWGDWLDEYLKGPPPSH